MHAFFYESLELGWSVLSEPEWVMFHLCVDIPLVNVLVSQEPPHLFARRSPRRLHERRWQIGFPVGVDEVVVQGVEDFNFAIGPEVKVD